MHTFAEILYQKFFLRDVVGKIAPGYIVCLAALNLGDMQMEDFFLAWQPSAFVLVLVELAGFYLMGVALQVAGELLGLLSASPKPHHVLLVPVGWLKRWPLFQQWWQINEDSADRLFRMFCSSQQLDPKIVEQSVYLAALKEGAGNLALALFIGLIAIWTSSGKPQLISSVLILLGTFFLWSGQLLFAKRQARFEVAALAHAGILNRGEAEAMGKNVGLRPEQLPAQRKES